MTHVPDTDARDRDGATEQPEHGNDRRRFLVWAVLAGFAKPGRLTERVLDELEREGRE